MRNISIELIPNLYKKLGEETDLIIRNFKEVNCINIPDLSRKSIRSWQACGFLKRKFNRLIPHIRAMDFPPNDKLKELKNYLLKNNIDEILLIKGDSITSEYKKKIYPNNTLNFIEQVKKYIPKVKIYAAIDTHRQSLKKEVDYTIEKKKLEIDGFFTQPIFQKEIISLYRAFFPDEKIFWGISPVFSEKSKKYWQNMNHVYFPNNYRFDLEYNTLFAKDLLKKFPNESFYFMPIRSDLVEYFSRVFH